MLATKKGAIALILPVLLIALGCPAETDRPTDELALEAAPAVVTHPVKQMQSSLQNLVQAQAAFHEDYARFAEDLTLLLEEYGFQPVGDATVTLHFEGTAPQHGYIARAVHPNTTEQCEVHHGETVPQGEQFTGQIVCTGQ